MPLEEGQVQIRDLVMGRGTPYEVNRFNPFARNVRADQAGERAWGHGSWSGAEWSESTPVPLLIVIHADAGGMTSWVDAVHELTAAFAPIGDAVADVEMRFTLGGREYVMFGRPRVVAPETEDIGLGWSRVEAAFVPLDPKVYAGAEAVATFGLPTFVGGLTVPFTVPFTIDAVQVDGQAELVNEGKAETGLRLTIAGPVQQPRVSLRRPDGTVQTLRFLTDLGAGQWLEVDTAARTVFLNGLPEASRRGQASGEWPLLPPGESTLLFRAAEESATAQVTATYRSAWW